MKVAKEVIEDDINTIIFTDEELLLQINDKLKKKERISQRTLRRWKAKSKNPEKLDKLGKSFVRLIKKALVKQKKHLFKKFRDEPNQWQKWAWIIERKFDDWNIRHKTDLTTGGKPLPPFDYVKKTRHNNGDRENKET